MAQDAVIAHVGDRIRIHPASDWFMRGEVYGRVVIVKFADDTNDAARIYRVVGERSGKRFWLMSENVLEVMP